MLRCGRVGRRAGRGRSGGERGCKAELGRFGGEMLRGFGRVGKVPNEVGGRGLGRELGGLQE